MTISKEILDELLKGVERPEDLLGDAGLMKDKLMERMLGAELTAHLGYEDGKEAPAGQTDPRNGASTNVLKGQDGEMPVAVPRDRASSFAPELVKKGQTRIDGMDDKIIGLHAAGLTVRDIQSHLLDLYGLKGFPEAITAAFPEAVAADLRRIYEARPAPIWPPPNSTTSREHAPGNMPRSPRLEGRSSRYLASIRRSARSCTRRMP